jgi:hypothetical protein
MEIDTTRVSDDTRSFNRPMPLVPMSGRGKELCDMLRKELGVPDGVREFEVRFAMNEAISVRCKYLPNAPRSDTSTIEGQSSSTDAKAAHQLAEDAGARHRRFFG